MDAFPGDVHLKERAFQLLAHGDKAAAVEVESFGLAAEFVFDDFLDISFLAGPVWRAAHGGDKMKIFVFFLQFPPFALVKDVRLVAAHLLIESVQKLLAGGGSGKGGYQNQQNNQD